MTQTLVSRRARRLLFFFPHIYLSHPSSFPSSCRTENSLGSNCTSVAGALHSAVPEQPPDPNPTGAEPILLPFGPCFHNHPNRDATSSPPLNHRQTASMWTSTARLVVAVVASAPLAAAIKNTDGSHCTKWCGNNQKTTALDEISCTRGGLQTSNGVLWENCVRCQLTSPYTQGNDSDLAALLYNLRRGMDKCLYKQSNPCATG